MTTGAFDDPTGNGDAFGQRLVIVEVGRVVEEIVRTVIHGPPISGGYGPARGTPADARRDSARLPAQDLQQVRSDPAILFFLVVGNEGQRRFPDILRHKDEVYDDGHGDLPRHRKLLEMIDLGEIAIDDRDPPFLSPVPTTKFIRQRLWCVMGSENPGVLDPDCPGGRGCIHVRYARASAAT